MADILNPTNSADDDAFDGIRDLAHTTATNAEIDKNPLFLSAEDYIVSRDAMATDRNYAHRGQIVLALQFLTAANFLEGGGATSASSSGSQQTSGTISSRTVGDFREEYRDTSTTRSIKSNVDISVLDIQDRIKYLKDTAIEIMDELTGQESSVDAGLGTPVALLAGPTPYE